METEKSFVALRVNRLNRIDIELVFSQFVIVRLDRTIHKNTRGIIQKLDSLVKPGNDRKETNIAR